MTACYIESDTLHNDAVLAYSFYIAWMIVCYIDTGTMHNDAVFTYSTTVHG